MIALWQYLGDLWPIIADYGRASAAIVACAAIVYFVPSLKVKVIAATVGLSVILCTIAFSVGLKRGNDLCEAEQARAEQAAKDRDKLQGSVAADDDDSRLAEILHNSKTNMERFNAFKAELAKHRDNACRLTPADRVGLRLDAETAADAESCGATAAGAKADAAGSCAAIGRDAKDALADTRAALAEANARLAASAAWYEAVRRRYRAARLR